MDKIFEAYETKKVRTIKGDFIDRLHSRYTVTLLFVLCILITLKQNDDGAIICWLPAFFSGDQAEYAHQLCWVNSTYYYPNIHDADLFPESLKHTIPYYQFILFILFGQALLFYLPSFIWNNMVSDSAGYIKKVLDQIEKADLVQKSIENFKQQLNNTKDDKTLKNLNENNDDVSNSINQIKEASQSNSSSSINTADQFNHETASLLLPSEFSQSMRETFQFVREKNKKSKSSKKDINYDLKLTSINEIENNDEKQNYSLFVKLPLDQKQVSFSDEKKTDTSNNQNPTTKKRIISFMKPTKGVKFLATQYMLLKIFNLTNVIVQIFLLHKIFGPTFFKYGYDFFNRLINQQDPFTLSKQFPLITFCDFYVHQNLRQIYSHSTQCILSINIYIEKFYVIIWFWMIMLLVVTFINILTWIYEIYLSKKYQFIKKYIFIKERMLNNELNEKSLKESDTLIDDEDFIQFQKKYLGKDGFVMLHMIKSVIGDIIFIELLYELWIDYKKNKTKFD